MVEYSRDITDVVLAVGDAEGTALSTAYITPTNIAAVVYACDAGLCQLVPLEKQVTYVHDRAWDVKTAVVLTMHGRDYFDKKQRERVVI